MLMGSLNTRVTAVVWCEPLGYFILGTGRGFPCRSDDNVLPREQSNNNLLRANSDPRGAEPGIPPHMENSY